jgi:PAS domain S-box-containing protein
MATPAVGATRTGNRPEGSLLKLPDSTRLRLTPYFLVLALPLAIGVWAFGNFAADNARDREDTQLLADLNTAADGYRHKVTAAAVQARSLARRPSIQRAVLSRDRTELRRFARLHPNVRFLAGKTTLAGRLPEGAPTSVVRIQNRNGIVGSVEVAAPLDARTLDDLRAAARLRPKHELVAIRGRAVVAGSNAGQPVRGRLNGVGNLELGHAEYRAATAPLVHGSPLRLAAVEPGRVVSAAEDKAKHRVWIAGLSILGGVALAAYALAPLFARSRFAQAQRAQAAQVLSHVGDGVFLVDPWGTISFWNPGAEALTGLVAAAALKRRPDEIFRGWSDHAPRPTPSNERPVAQTGRYEVNGHELWLSMSGVESPVGTVYAFRDLTEEYRLEETRADFVATVSHELRTPLASIHGAANTLRSRDEQLRPSTRRELIEIVFEQSERLARLVDTILLANQLSSGTAHVERRSFDAAAVANDAVGGIRPAVPREIELELHVAESLPAALGDPERVRQILVNLVENACKYSPGGGHVDVTVSAHNGSVRFSVRDEGLGVPFGEQERIFEKFYRLDASMSRGVGGSGLGLFISRELVELMQGRLWVTSQPGLGSTFSFELPVAEPASAALEATGA